MAMPGYALLFEDERGATCQGCHTLGAWAGTVGPELTDVANKGYGLEYQFNHLKDPASEVAGSTMPPFEGTYTDDEVCQISAFLETLGKPERAADAEYTAPDCGAGPVAGGAPPAGEEAPAGGKEAPAGEGEEAPAEDATEPVTAEEGESTASLEEDMVETTDAP
jgi:cytochrome c1